MIDPLTMSVMAALMSPTAPMVCSMPQSQEQDVAQAVKAVEKVIEDFNTAQQGAYKKHSAAETDEERQAILENIPQQADFFPQMREIAEAHPKTEAAAKAAQWVLMQLSSEGEWALQMMLEDFMDSEEIESVARVSGRLTSANILALDRIRKESTNDRARAVADYTRGKQLIMMSNAIHELAEEGSSGDPMSFNYMGAMDIEDNELKTELSSSGMADEYQRAGEALLAHCQEAYTEVKIYEGSDLMIGAMAERALFEINNLQIGDVVPDIEGVDAEGIAFKLSDYKGQVVIIDFWGFW